MINEEVRGSTYHEWLSMAKFSEEYEERYGNRLKAVVVFGKLAEDKPFPPRADVDVLTIIEGYTGPAIVKYPIIGSLPHRPRYLLVRILTPEEFQARAERGDPFLIKVSEAYTFGYEFRFGYVDEVLELAWANRTYTEAELLS
jgi:hypothetical protein